MAAVYSNRAARLSWTVENLDQAPVEGSCPLGEVFDLSVEADHIPYLNALLVARIFPSFGGEAHRLEAALRHQPKGTVHKLVAAGHPTPQIV